MNGKERCEMLRFRKLHADEIDVRVAQIGEGKHGKWLSLLLYKDARCDQNILDETVGPMNWKKSYELIDGQLFCTIELWDEEKKQWVGKQDVGVESNTEAEKGRASDAQKRAAFAWGLGRELYTAPSIFLNEDVCKIDKNAKGKLACYDRFSVKSISYAEDGSINGLCIINSKTHKVVYNWGLTIDTPQKAENNASDSLSDIKHNFIQRCTSNGLEAQKILEEVGWTIDKGKATIDDYSKAELLLDQRLGVQS
jgi:hypothetical protein